MREKQEKTQAEKYRELLANRKVETIDVTAPSGFVFKFKKPSKYAMIFSTNRLPQFAASAAVELWDAEKTKDGKADALSMFNNMKPQDKAEIFGAAWSIRERVLFLSVEPKLVAGPATEPNELSTDDIADDDLAFLFEWVAAGGESGLMSASFPAKPGLRVVGGVNRKERRAKAKLTSGIKRAG